MGSQDRSDEGRQRGHVGPLTRLVFAFAKLQGRLCAAIRHGQQVGYGEYMQAQISIGEITVVKVGAGPDGEPVISPFTRQAVRPEDIN